MAGFRRALTNCFNNYLAQDGLAKKYKVVTTGDDARQGLTAVVSVKMPDPKFSSQTKDKLVSSEVTPVVATAVGEALNTFLQENPKDAAAICEKIVQSAREREAVRKARELSRGRKGLELNTIPDKLVSCRSKDPSICELFLVEGDSAGGSAKNGRDSNFQAVLPLRGKILNVEKAGFHRVIQSQQIGTLVTALGCGIGQDDYDPEKFRYHKVIIMTDADVDGAHIRILLLTFFFRQMPELIERGYVYVAQPPLYKYQRKKDIQYVLNDEEALQFNTNQALEFGTVHPDEGAPALPRAHLEELFKLYNRVIRSNSQLLKKYDSELIVRLLREPLFSEEQTADEEGMRAWTEHLVAEMPANPTEGLTFRGELSHDLIKQRYYPVIVKHHHGIDYRYELGEAFLGSEEFSLIRRTNEALKGLLGPGAFIAVGNRVKKVSHFHDVYTYLMQESIKGWSVQRYKGLGEMNPEQLSETTMSPDTRLLLKVEPHLAMQADLLFTQLMGDDVEYRRDYIQQHSEEAMLDI